MRGDVGVMAIVVVVDILGEFDCFAFRPCVVCSQGSIRSSQRGKFDWAIGNS